MSILVASENVKITNSENVKITNNDPPTSETVNCLPLKHVNSCEPGNVQML